MLLLITTGCYATEERIVLLQNGDLSAWGEKFFDGETRYETASANGRLGVRATSQESSSGMVIKQRVDLRKTPILSWYWRVDTPLTHTTERTKVGDDFAARVYIIVFHPLFPWRSKVVNYVWSSQQPIGSNWVSPFLSVSHHIALRSHESPIREWVHEQRNVRNDLKVLFNSDIDYIDAVAIMTDSDNTAARAIAYYADIAFDARDFHKKDR